MGDGSRARQVCAFPASARPGRMPRDRAGFHTLGHHGNCRRGLKRALQRTTKPRPLSPEYGTLPVQMQRQHRRVQNEPSELSLVRRLGEKDHRRREGRRGNPKVEFWLYSLAPVSYECRRNL